MHKKRIKNKDYFYTSIRDKGGSVKTIYLGSNKRNAIKKEKELGLSSSSFKFNLQLIIIILIILSIGLTGFFSITGYDVLNVSEEIVEEIIEEDIQSEEIIEDIQSEEIIEDIVENNKTLEINESNLTDLNGSVEINESEEIELEINESTLTDLNFSVEINESEEIELEEIKVIINESKLNISINESKLNETILINQTDINQTIEITQYDVVIHQPVKWKKRVLLDAPSNNISISIPKEATNISIVEIINEKEIEIKEDKIIFEEELDGGLEIITGSSIVNVNWFSNIFTFFTSIFSNLFESTGYAIVNENLNGSNENLEQEIIIIEEVEELEIEYETPGPNATESVTNDYKKQITVFSDIHYKNILAYTNITNAPLNSVNLYWLNNGTKEKVNFSAYDSDGDSLVDYIEWIVPHLSNQTYEVEITILNVQSYPVVGGNWEVRFNTTGNANLSIKAINGTTWNNIDENEDLKFLQIMCGNKTLNYSWINQSVFVGNYSCNSTGKEISKVLTEGKHDLEFDFGGQKAYARNSASKPWSVQTGFAYMGSGETSTDVALGTAVDRNSSFLLIDYTSDSSSQNAGRLMVTGNITNSTHLSFQRYTGTNYVNVSWSVIEGPITVQHGFKSIGMLDNPVYENIDDIENLSHAMVIVNSGANQDNDWSYDEGLALGKFVNTSRIELSVYSNAAPTRVEWSVIKFSDDVDVQSGSTTLTTTSSTTVDLGSAVNDSRSWLYFSRTADAAGLLQTSIRGNLLNSTTIQFDKAGTTGNNGISWFVVEFPPGVTVQRDSQSSLGTLTYDLSVSSVNVSKSFSFVTNDCGGTGNAHPRSNYMEFFTNSTNLRLKRDRTGQSQNHEWQVISFSGNPTSVLSSPADSSTDTDGNVTFECNSTDDYDLSSITLYHDIGGSFVANETNSVSGNSVSTTFNLTNIADGNYIWNCLVNDSDGNNIFAPSNYSLEVNTSLACGTTLTSSTTLTSNLSCSGNALIIGANDIVLNCADYTITYGSGASGSGIQDTTGYDNVTITNCNIVDGSSSGLFRHAISMTQSNSDILIENNTISTLNFLGYALTSKSSNSTIKNNVMTTSGSTAYGVSITGIVNTSLLNNNITTSGVNSIGIKLYATSSDLNISGNILNTTDSAIGIAGTSTSIFDNNIILETSESDGHGIFISSSSSSNNLTNNNITTGAGGSGIKIDGSDQYIFNNYIIASGSGAVGLDTTTFSSSEILNNTINSTTNGIYIGGNSDNNDIKNNNITYAGTDAIKLLTVVSNRPENNNFTNNSFGTIDQYDFFISSGAANETYLIDQPITNYSIDTPSLVYFKDTNEGEIKFTETINGTGSNLSSDIQISNNLIDVDTSSQIGFNSSANLTFYNINLTSLGINKATAYRNGAKCGASCTSFSNSSDTYYFSVTSFSNYSIGENNTAPESQSVSLTSDDAQNRTNGNLTGSFSYYDADGDSQSINETKWYNNSVEIISLSNLTLIGYGNTSKGENWTFSARVNDGYVWSDWTNSSILTILNSAPTDPSFVVFNDTSLYTGDSVNCSASGSTDVDADAITYYYKFNDTAGTLQDWSSTSIYDCSGAGCDRGDTLFCHAKATTSDANSSIVSNSTTILNSVPTLPTQNSPANSSTISVNHTLINCSGSTDADSDAITYYYYGDVVDGSTYLSTNNSGTTYNWTGLSDDTLHYWKCAAGDGSDNSSNTTIFQFSTDINDAPSVTIPILNSSSGNNITSDRLDCYFTVSDVDAGETLYANYTWYKDGVLNLSGQVAVDNGTEKIINLSSGNTTKGEEWICGINPYDEEVYGTSKNSSILTILNSAPTFDFNLSAQSATVGTEFSYDINCSDLDSDSLIYYDNTTLFDINSTSGLITDTPSSGDVGTTNITITCGDGSVNTTDSFNYTINAAVSEEVVSGGGGSSSVPECTVDEDCGDNERCIDEKCTILFDIKITHVDSPIIPGEILDFTYYLKAMTSINDDVIIKFWVEDDSGIILEGKDVIYVGDIEDEIIEIGELYLFSDMYDKYEFHVQLVHNNYSIESVRPIEISYDVQPVLEVFTVGFSEMEFTPLEFNLSFYFNVDQTIPIKVNHEIIKDGEIVWSESRSLSVTRNLVLGEIIEDIEIGDYEYKLKVEYLDEIYELSKQFSVSEVREAPKKGIDILKIVYFVLLGFGVILFFYLIVKTIKELWEISLKRKRQKKLIIKPVKLKKRKVREKTVHVRKKFKKVSEREKLVRKIKKWKSLGYDTRILEQKLEKPEKIYKKKEFEKKIKYWESKGYDTTILKHELGLKPKVLRVSKSDKKLERNVIELEKKIKEWKAEGYNTSILEERLKRILNRKH